MKFYKCNKCGKIVTLINETAIPTICCGEAMSEIIAGTVEASREKHIPVCEVNGDLVKVTVGSVEHPMIAEHYIEWVVVETESGYQIKYLKPSVLPKAEFKVNEKVIGVYAYCNLHGLWKA